jgi:hypothetical protein
VRREGIRVPADLLRVARVDVVHASALENHVEHETHAPRLVEACVTDAKVVDALLDGSAECAPVAVEVGTVGDALEESLVQTGGRTRTRMSVDCDVHGDG